MKKKLVCILGAMLIMLNAFCTIGFCSSTIEDATAQIMEVAEGKDGNVTITDIRKHTNGITQEYTKAEINEILEIVNDYYGGQLAAADYYKSILNEISDSDVESIIVVLENGIEDGGRGNGPSINPLIFVFVGGGVVVIGGIIAALILVIGKLSKSGNKKTGPPIPSRADSDEKRKDSDQKTDSSEDGLDIDYF